MSMNFLETFAINLTIITLICYNGLPVSGLSVSFVNSTGVEPDSSRCYYNPHWIKIEEKHFLNKKH